VRATLLALACAGCLDTVGPDVGAPLRASCSSVDSDPATDVHFDADIRIGIFGRADVHCTRCHTPGGATPIGLDVGGLDLSSEATLVEGGVHGTAIVVPGDPCSSLLVQKLGEAPPFGARMPLDGPPYLDALDLQLISDWIAEGAHDN
jgi:hypothetical protein